MAAFNARLKQRRKVHSSPAHLKGQLAFRRRMPAPATCLAPFRQQQRLRLQPQRLNQRAIHPSDAFNAPALLAVSSAQWPDRELTQTRALKHYVSSLVARTGDPVARLNSRRYSVKGSVCVKSTCRLPITWYASAKSPASSGRAVGLV